MDKIWLTSLLNKKLKSTPALRVTSLRLVQNVITEKTKDFSKEHRKSYVIEPLCPPSPVEAEKQRCIREFFGNWKFHRG